MEDTRQRESVAAAAAGFALSRLLSGAPDDGVLERLRDPRTRSSWPLADVTSRVALAEIGEGTEPERVRSDWIRVLGAGGLLSLRESDWLDVPEAEVVDDLERLYASVEFRRDSTGTLASDHLAVELLYLAQLAASAAGPSARGERDTAEVTYALIGDVRARHVDLFCEQAMSAFEANVETPELRAVPALVRGFLTALEQLPVTVVAAP
jgi:TorA maturation chaperone TorD